MSKTAFIYPGQGAQKAGMGADFYENSEIARYIFDQAGEELGLDMKALCFEENDKLDLTEYTQAAMVTTCLAMTRVAENKGLKADVTAGLSLGEYPAIAIAGCDPSGEKKRNSDAEYGAGRRRCYVCGHLHGCRENRRSDRTDRRCISCKL